MSRARWSNLLLAALVFLGAGVPLSGQAPAADLIDAINKRDEPRAALLLKQGADPNVRDAVTQPAITAAAYFGLEKTVRALVASGADLRALDNDGAGPLHAAALGGHAGIVRLLLDRGLGVNEAARADGMTPDCLRCGARSSERHASAAGTARGRQPRRFRRQFAVASRRDARPHCRGAPLAGVRRERQRLLQARVDTFDGGRVGR